MSDIKNINTCPNPLNGVYNPPAELKYANGFRIMPDAPPLAEGYTRISITPADLDGIHGQWVVVDRLTSDIEAEEAAANKAAHLDRWILENAFMMVCQQYFGTPGKRGTKELLGKAFELMEMDAKAAMTAFAVVIGLDKELVRAGGDLWWDGCEWHDDPDAIAGAAAYLGVTP